MPALDKCCEIEECNNSSINGVYCEMHRRRFRDYGTPTPLKICFECKVEFVWIDKAVSFSDAKKPGGYKRIYCRDCASFLLKHKEFLPRYPQGVTNHGITVTEYVNLLLAQDFSCALCDNPYDSYKRMHIDHDHSHCAGAYGCRECVRGLVCLQCNILVGHIENRMDVLDKYEHKYKFNRPLLKGSK